jgi:hypothetical protein
MQPTLPVLTATAQTTAKPPATTPQTTPSTAKPPATTTQTTPSGAKPAAPATQPAARPAAAATAAPPVDGGWPRQYTIANGGSVIVYQPQTSTWEKQTHLVAFSAVTYRSSSKATQTMARPQTVHVS